MFATTARIVHKVIEPVSRDGHFAIHDVSAACGADRLAVLHHIHDRSRCGSCGDDIYLARVVFVRDRRAGGQVGRILILKIPRAAGVVSV
jgi:hypothetical protein